ncbi:MAG: hypothetical protein BGN88_13595 [Clostridiales bacterium 43-6]|nr:MAG: hypothetical protein BGN88_13595 [Clostridiales bacterium 43-6]
MPYDVNGNRLFDFDVTQYEKGEDYSFYVAKGVLTFCNKDGKKELPLLQNARVDYLGNGVFFLTSPDGNTQYAFDSSGKELISTANAHYNTVLSNEGEPPFLFLTDNDRLYLYDIERKKEIIVRHTYGEWKWNNGFLQVDDGKTKLYDRDGNMVVDFETRLNDITITKDGYVGTDISDGGEYGLIFDNKGKELYRQKGRLEYVAQGMYQTTRGNYTGLINSKGEWLYRTLNIKDD